MATSLVTGVIISCCGLVLSLQSPIPVGGAIVLVASLLFFASLLYRSLPTRV